MAFKKLGSNSQSVSSPEKLIFDLPRRKIPGVLTHQSEVMRSYAETAIDKPDVALQLPTGSGKTLVGALIAEWLRRKRSERVVYLAPTKQLVNQVVNQCESRYGIQANGFTGQASKYSPQARAEYRTAEKIAVTTYSSLFNTNPFFNDADVIIIDDAHAAENYIASMWSVNVYKGTAEHFACFEALTACIKSHVDGPTYYKLKSSRDENNGWVEKLPSPTLLKAGGEIREVLDEHTKGVPDLQHPWSLIRDNLHGCHFYFNESEILVRPLIPPTWTHRPFVDARQRIYMSATLGTGGDLERLFGRKSIYRVATPGGWDRQGVGRRLFLFPGMSLDDGESTKLRLQLMKTAGRSLALVPSKAHGDGIRQEVQSQIGYQTLDASDIEKTKDIFTRRDHAVAVIANRYDGIDFPGDECRLTFVEGLPTATNLQERFLMSRMGANILFNERIQTRVLQAIGRCTRSLEDYSAVVVNGADFQDYLTDKKLIRHLHPEIQAEILFGIEQSKNAKPNDFVNFMSTFLANGEDWESANQDIIDLRDTLRQERLPSIGELEASVAYEVQYQESLWHGDFLEAMDAASRVLGATTGEALRGYRALWNYLAGSAAVFAADFGQLPPNDKAERYFSCAKNAAVGLRWLVNLATPKRVDTTEESEPDTALRAEQIENIENVLEKLGTSHDRRYAAREKSVLEGIVSDDQFESSQVLLGELLGFNAAKRETDGSPDPWWQIGSLCFVFEDHAGAKSSSALSVEKARQAADHPRWIRLNVPGLEQAEIIPVLITPTTASSKGAEPHLNEVYLWPLEEYRTWARQALITIREMRKTFSAPGDLVWRADAIGKLRASGLDAPSIRRDRLLVRASSRFNFT